MKPATPLPWQASRRDDPTHGNWICTDITQALNYGGKVVTRTLNPDSEAFQNAAYLAHAANAYPRLVEALREHAYYGTQRGTNAINLLRELGELK